MSQARALSSDEVRGLREELASGGTPTVWFTSSAVGVPEGRSGKVIALDDLSEGDFIQVRPAGSKDVLSFSPGEVTLVKPPRKRKEPASAAAKTAQSTAETKSPADKPAAPADKPGESAAKSAGSRESQASAAKAAGTKASGSKADTASSGAATPASSAATTSTAATSASRRKPRQPSGATVTLSADQTGQWNVEVTTGKKRVLRPTPVAASAVAQAAKALHDDVAEAVEPLLQAAREQQRSRVEQLQRELEDAQRMLDDLTE